MHLGGDEVLACVQFGLFLVADDDGRRYAVFVAGARRDHVRDSLRVEVASGSQDDARHLLDEIRGAMRRLDVYRGQLLSLSMSQVLGPTGPPGVGKTLTVKYLCRRLPERTVAQRLLGAVPPRSATPAVRPPAFGRP